MADEFNDDEQAPAGQQPPKPDWGPPPTTPPTDPPGWGTPPTPPLGAPYPPAASGGPTPPWEAAPVGPPTPTVPASAPVLRRLALVAIAAGLVLALAPLGRWFGISFGSLEGGVNGWGMEYSDGDLGSDDDDSSDDSDEDDLGWILGDLPDGVVVSVLGGATAVLGLSWRQKLTAGTISDPMPLAKIAVALGSVALVWTTWSWFRFDSEFDDLLSESVADEPMAAFFLGSIDSEIGYGMMLAWAAALALLGVGAHAWYGQSKAAAPGSSTP